MPCSFKKIMLSCFNYATNYASTICQGLPVIKKKKNFLFFLQVLKVFLLNT